MAGILGITANPEPANVIQPSGRGVQGTPGKTTQVSDELSVSPEAEKAATAARLLADSNKESEIRAELIEKARKNIEEGTHRVQQVVLIVASRVSKFLDDNSSSVG
ncbi:MAG: flagellar biosynthesis anti-sigma factor FlgM [Candidatus Hydrogenedentes bacterium]|nr:flagellar biosynthesis anti-sigma factor FlgM [Candidatus Hydrogenedentota bacterium]